MVTSVLLKKLRRDLLSRAGALGALLVIVAIGVGSFVSMASVHRDLEAARNIYYREQRVGDFTIDLKRAPAWAVAEAAGLPGVKRAHGRIDLEVRTLVGDDPQPISGRAISLPVPRRPVVNDVLLMRGTWFSEPDAREVILNDAFAAAHGLVPGARLRVLLLDREYDLLVVGTAMSPEFVYLIPSSGGFAPDPARFAVMYLPERFLAAASDMEGGWNQLVGQVHDRERGSILAMLDSIERHLDPYGVTRSVPYFDQPSIRFLADELVGLRTSATVMPLLFLLVATLVLNVLMGRLVAQQRGIIGTLKALGHGSGAIARHYAGYGVAVGIAGGGLGVAFGLWMQRVLLDVYRTLYALPGIEAHPHLDFLLFGLVVSVLFAVLGTWRGLRHATRLTPAAAMHPPAPERGGRILLERLPLLWRPLPFRAKMVLRTVFRNPFRSGVSVVGSVIATALIVASLANWDSLRFVISHEFTRVAHEDLNIALRDPIGLEGGREVADLSSITYVEPQLAVPADLTHGPRVKQVVVTGLATPHALHTPLDSDGHPLAIPEEGLVLTRKLAEVLAVRAGGVVRLRPLIGERRAVAAPVVAVVDTYLNLGAYADLRYLSRLLGEEPVANTLLCTTDVGDATPTLLEELDRRPAVLGLGTRRRSLERIEESFGNTMGVMIGILVLFAGLIAFGSVLNAALVSVNERRREVGTLRVIGYSTRQVASIFAGESALLNGVGIALGLVAGVGLTHLLARAYSTELYRFPALLHPVRFLHSTLLMVLFVGAAQLLVGWVIRRLPWLAVLNVKE